MEEGIEIQSFVLSKMISTIELNIALEDALVGKMVLLLFC
jgi:hypothetical protein